MNISFLRATVTTVLISICFLYGFGQDRILDEDYTVEYINQRLKSKCQLKLQRKDFLVEFYEDNELVRIDHVFPETIDPEGIYYSEDEGALILRCFEGAGRCIERSILKLDRRMGYDRCNLTADCTDQDCSGLETAVRHLIYLYTLDEYERTKPFEEK